MYQSTYLNTIENTTHVASTSISTSLNTIYGDATVTVTFSNKTHAFSDLVHVAIASIVKTR